MPYIGTLAGAARIMTRALQEFWKNESRCLAVRTDLDGK
jgi:hypothetical protein